MIFGLFWCEFPTLISFQLFESMASNKVPVKAMREFFAIAVTMCVHEIVGSGLASGRPPADLA